MDYSASFLFHTLDPPRTPWNRWLTSLGIHLAFVFVFIAIPVAVHQSVTSPPHYVAVRLDAPPVHPSPAIKIQVQEPVVRRTPVKAPPIVAAKTIPAPPVKPLLPVKPLSIEPPVIEAPEAVRLPQPKYELPASPVASPPKPVVVRTEVFAAGSAAPMGPKPSIHDVKLGGFGDPEGVPASTASPKGLTAATVGAFDVPSGSGQGGSAGHAKVVAVAGFASAGSSGSSAAGSHAGVPVHASGFGDYTTSPAPSATAKTAAPSPPAVTPVEITYKPKPAYTPEARQQKLEGEVQLEVIFSAGGQVQILRVLRGLGLGLDESARAAAAQIRFHPGTKAGSPVDMRGIVHIVFELS